MFGYYFVNSLTCIYVTHTWLLELRAVDRFGTKPPSCSCYCFAHCACECGPATEERGEYIRCINCYRLTYQTIDVTYKKCEEPVSNIIEPWKFMQGGKTTAKHAWQLAQQRLHDEGEKAERDLLRLLEQVSAHQLQSIIPLVLSTLL